jgi:hypothetical protein
MSSGRKLTKTNHVSGILNLSFSWNTVNVYIPKWTENTEWDLCLHVHIEAYQYHEIVLIR